MHNYEDDDALGQIEMEDSYGPVGLYRRHDPPSRSLHIVDVMKDRYTLSKAAKVKDSCTCPSCGKAFVKKSYQQAFCSNKGMRNCKDTYWNSVIPSRNAR